MHYKKEVTKRVIKRKCQEMGKNFFTNSTPTYIMTGTLFTLQSVEPKITAGPMCGLWYENNQFGYNEIKIKGKSEQKQIYYDRLSSSGNLKAVVVAAWNSIKPFLLKGRKQALISPTMLTAWRKTGKHDNLQKHQYYPCYPLVAWKWLTQADSRATFSLTDWNTKPHQFVSWWLPYAAH